MKSYDEMINPKTDAIHIFTLMGLFIVSILKLIIYNNTK